MATVGENELLKSVLCTTESNFENNALAVYQFQYLHNPIYKAFCNFLKGTPNKVGQLTDIPFLPIQFYKNKQVKCTQFNEALIFESSGTTGTINSKHYVKSLALYEASFTKTFTQFYGAASNYCIIGLLPSYLEKGASSLVYMVNTLIKLSGNQYSGFYLYNFEELKNVLLSNEQNKQPTLLFGVTYALLDFAEAYPLQLKYCTVIETGGMKGRKQELSRQKVHTLLKNNLGITTVHSEYGMTELLSQAYSYGNGIYNCPPYMRIFLRHEDEPLTIKCIAPKTEKISGVVNIIDLANLHSCAFIATDDVGILYANNSFEITGRLQNSDARGCGLMLL